MPATSTPIWEQSAEDRLAAAERRVCDEWLVVRVTRTVLRAGEAARNVPQGGGNNPANARRWPRRTTRSPP
ncbi:MAG: hypothetical protein AB7K63_03740 [Vicinamibacterales bacterium]